MTLDFDVIDARWNAIAGLEAIVRSAILATVAANDTRLVTVQLADDATVRALNKEWRGQDKATNVLSFPAAHLTGLPDDEQQPLGDIVLAYETVVAESRDAGKRPVDHVSHLLVHGVLHLMGYDHGNEQEADLMEGRERDILATLGIADPYLT